MQSTDLCMKITSSWLPLMNSTDWWSFLRKCNWLIGEICLESPRLCWHHTTCTTACQNMVVIARWPAVVSISWIIQLFSTRSLISQICRPDSRLTGLVELLVSKLIDQLVDKLFGWWGRWLINQPVGKFVRWSITRPFSRSLVQSVSWPGIKMISLLSVRSIS